jgi:hypothetical protein
LIAVVAAPFAAAAFLSDKQLPSLPTALLLGDVILVSIICSRVLAPARTELGLLAGQLRLADETKLFHMTVEVGLQAYHIQAAGKRGRFQMRL